jgi:hypothetical protein
MVIMAMTRVAKGSSAGDVDVRKLARAVGESPIQLTIPQVAPPPKKTRNTGAKATSRATVKSRTNTTTA